MQEGIDGTLSAVTVEVLELGPGQTRDEGEGNSFGRILRRRVVHARTVHDSTPSIRRQLGGAAEI